VPSSAERWGSDRERLETQTSQKTSARAHLELKAGARQRKRSHKLSVDTWAEPEPGPEMLGIGPPGPHAPMDRSMEENGTESKKVQATAVDSLRVTCRAGP